MRPGFRLKLVAAMMAVVALATGAALLVAQTRLGETQRRMSEQRVRAQFDHFAQLQASRLAVVEERCLNLVSGNVRLRAAIEEKDAELLRSVAADELRALNAEGPGRTRPSLVQFFSADGEWIAEPAGRPPDAGTRALVAQVLQGGPAQRLGLASLPGPDGVARLHEMVATRAALGDGRQVFGALLVAFPAELPAPAARADHRFAVWVGGLLHSPAGSFSPVAEAGLSAALAGRPAGVHDFPLPLDSVAHRVLTEPLDGAGGGGDRPLQVGVYSLAESLRQQAHLRWQLLGLGAAAMALALGLSLVLSHGLSVPIRELVAGTRAVQGGQFDTQVLVRSRDELGQLAGAFNEMTAGLALKERYRTILNTVADEKVARQLLEGGLALGGEVRRVTVLFCDIRGFTAHTENMAPPDVIELLNEHMTALTGVVKRCHGVLDKFVGDLLMALFGAPLSRPEDAFDAARCALGIIAERRRLNVTSRHSLEVGIGLATGDVVAGCMGSADRLNYTVLGERVNLGSRLCGIAGPGQVVMDETTRAALGDRAEVRALEPVKLKGFTAPVPAFQLLALRGEPAE